VLFLRVSSLRLFQTRGVLYLLLRLHCQMLPTTLEGTAFCISALRATKPSKCSAGPVCGQFSVCQQPFAASRKAQFGARGCGQNC